ncbi:ESX secretion-associated protein EspG [Amycolatopsis cihanbeyliensis]|uniref:ESAT-6 protein secretion system EspG family protein n=1 Tax=Amycolatopsis cihanbeyliensis TaxID=1128664 RepID=A0A542DLI1_AMYCI|nr:ESX secretion-associated protein EspG [Amycolatopsis cihanbeyliensis]TQJ03884.1 ESAT-6 protein secretion system EspG family protein [Amycolatopsis cihanbeyliensis]
MRYDRVELGLTTYKTLLAEHDLGEAHLTLAGGEQWHPSQEREQLRTRAWTELDELGLLRGGRVREGFLDTLHLLQRPGTEYYTWTRIDGQPVTVRTAFTGRDAVLAIANRHTLYLFPSDAKSAAVDLAVQLPEVEPAYVHSLNCAEADYKALLAGEPLPAGSSATDAKRIRPWLEAPRVNEGQLFAAVRGGSEQRIADTHPPTWIDTEWGRFLVGMRGGWITLTGAGHQEIAAKLTDMEAELRGR